MKPTEKVYRHTRKVCRGKYSRCSSSRISHAEDAAENKNALCPHIIMAIRFRIPLFSKTFADIPSNMDASLALEHPKRNNFCRAVLETNTDKS